MLFRYKYLVI